ncbi:MAG: bifunctional adenosylcobinamide kinase/adenosylcobinamide-phosphate guanylyltransferase [Chloroflexi bacterium]|nr:bifunctional adenosylcobinamide kinase/adenosylcobinamide-phosphate guanylyltransferase [Chloroflexota bacterium]MCI0579324.1 bifunctional adenosylcobinamide kinase/adenosylcobinamide-phosphate guanylyltransferase [Chloroflexota bacterium]MCI0644967.1 bifunctional adenosylcobinamide kinase/adenosylcobinamide-phosphate guanylyltransferase [Chloroflexota bacterium]MCI0727846.1 bifunctional adenosylcobinamide kinase/adenosylcobinamide-phosphate guanylyltransferase [Chloroflexota bacterium]
MTGPAGASKRLTLILGGARSGKSAYAQQLAQERGQAVVYVATAQPGDEEMAARIAAHRQARPAHWQTLEISLGVGEALRGSSDDADVILLDCLTLLASNVILALPEPTTTEAAEMALAQEVDSLLAAYAAGTAGWIVVSNEVGLGLVPPNLLGRAYRDALGRANQRLAQTADEVLFMISGLPLRLKG